MGFNSHQWYLQGLKQTGAANTFIGGVSSTLNTKSALATKLGIAESSISYFAITGSDIEARIEIGYQIGSATFLNDLNLLYFKDVEGIVSSIRNQAFEGANNLITAIFPNASTPDDSTFRDCFSLTLLDLNSTTLINGAALYNAGLKEVYLPNLIQALNSSSGSTSSGCFRGMAKVTNIYIPKCTQIGRTTGYDGVFLDIKSGCKIYVDPSMETINAGSPDGDLTSAISNGATISYVQNFTAPNSITDLSIGDIYATGLQVNFTVPTGNTNTIDYYEAWVNGAYKSKIVSGGFILDLTPSTDYTIEIKPVDIYYNKSTSNVIAQTTSATESYPISNIVSYYKMEDNVLDSVGENHGVPTAITYENGLAGKAAVFNGSTSKILIPSENNLSFPGAFSVVYAVKFNASPTGKFIHILTKDEGTPNREFFINYHSNGFRILIWDGSANVTIYAISTTPVTVGQTYIITHTFNGGVLATGIKTYINAVEVSTTKGENASFAGMENTAAKLEIGFWEQFPDRALNGTLEGPAFFDVELNAAEVSEINSKLNSGQHLI